jgi:hypothetical protein
VIYPERAPDKLTAYQRIARTTEKRSKRNLARIREVDRVLDTTIDQLDAIANTLEDLRKKLTEQKESHGTPTDD